jgi:nodulation protein E
VPNVGRRKAVNYAMSNSFAFGGLNAVLVFGPAPA